MNEKELNLIKDEVSRGNANAQFKLAMMYIYGDGVPEDNVYAAELLQKASDEGHMEAQYNLGICYHYGYGVKIDYKLAFESYMKSALQGYAKGKILVAKFYYEGLFVKKDYTEAVKWLFEAEKLNDITKAGYEKYLLGVCYAKGHGVLQNDEEAKRWFQKAAEEGDTNAQKAFCGISTL